MSHVVEKQSEESLCHPNAQVESTIIADNLVITALFDSHPLISRLMLNGNAN